MNTVEQPGIDETTSPVVIDHAAERISEAPPVTETPDDSEFQKHKESRGYTPKVEVTKGEEFTPAEITGESQPVEIKPEEKKAAERWQDPDTGDHYDMRHKVARRVKTLLEDRGKARGEAETLRKQNAELMQALMERTQPDKTQTPPPAVQTDAQEPDPNDSAKYPEGQFDRAFIRDLARFEAKQVTEGEFRTARTHAEEHQARAAEAQIVSQWQQTLPEARKKYSNFDDALAAIPNTPDNAPIVRLMLSSPVGNDLAYVLGTQPKALEAYSRAPNAESRQRFLYHIEAQLIQAARAAGSTTPKPTTSAPAPTSPVHAGAGPAGPIDWTRTDDPDQLARWKSLRTRR